MFKKICLVVVAVLLFSVVAMGCSNTSTEEPSAESSAAESSSAAPEESAEASSEAPAESSDAPAESSADASAEYTSSMTDTYVIGYNNWGQGVYALDLIEQKGRYVNELYGNQFDAYNDEFKADKLQTDIQNMISSGVDGIMFFGVVDTAILNVANMCADAEVPFVIFDQIPVKEDMIATLEENPFYVGSIGVNNSTMGKNMGELAASEGNQTALILGGAVGDPVHDMRVAGFTETFEANGGTVLNVGRGTDPSEAVTKMDDLLAANADADCVYALTGDFASGALTALENKGITDMKVYASDVDSITLDNIASGVVEMGDGGSPLCTYLAAIMLQNYLDGHAFQTAEGKAPYINYSPIFFIGAEEAPQYKEYLVNGELMTDNQIMSLTWRYNPDIDFETFETFMTSFSMDTMIAAHGD